MSAPQSKRRRWEYPLWYNDGTEPELYRIVDPTPMTSISRPAAHRQVWRVRIYFHVPEHQDFGDHRYIWKHDFDGRPTWAEVYQEFIDDPNTPYSSHMEFDINNGANRVEQMCDEIGWPAEINCYWDHNLITSNKYHARSVEYTGPRFAEVKPLVCLVCGFQRWLGVVDRTRDGIMATRCGSCEFHEEGVELDESLTRSVHILQILQDRIDVGFAGIQEHKLRPSLQLEITMNLNRRHDSNPRFMDLVR